MSRRLHFIDAARSFAIGLALFAHAAGDFGGWGSLGSLPVPLAFVTRTATPLFALLFGIMLELVYVVQAETKGMAPVARRLLLRSAQCYLGYVITALSGFLGFYLSLSQGARALIFLDHAHHGNILRFYCVALILAVPLVWLRRRFGAWVPALLLPCIWGCDVMLKRYAGVNFGVWDPWVGIFFGTGTLLHGPSVWHGFTFIFAGMLIAGSLRDWREHGLAGFDRDSTRVVLVAMSVIAYLALDVGILNVVRGYIDVGIYRWHNHIGYYAFGVSTSVLTLLLLSRIIPLDGILSRWADIPLEFGRSSLFSFTLSNCILNFFPAELRVKFVPFLLPLSLLFVAVMLVLVNLRRLILLKVPNLVSILLRRRQVTLLG